MAKGAEQANTAHNSIPPDMAAKVKAAIQGQEVTRVFPDAGSKSNEGGEASRRPQHLARWQRRIAAVADGSFF